MSAPTTITHVAGIMLGFGSLRRQRCGWCGALLIDEDLTRIAYALCGLEQHEDENGIYWGPRRNLTGDYHCRRPLNHDGEHGFAQPTDGEPPMFPIDRLVEVTRGNEDTGLSTRMSAVLDGIPSAEGPGHTVPHNCCMRLPPEMTRGEL